MGNANSSLSTEAWKCIALQSALTFVLGKLIKCGFSFSVSHQLIISMFQTSLDVALFWICFDGPSRGFLLLLGYPQASVLHFFTRPPRPLPASRRPPCTTNDGASLRAHPALYMHLPAPPTLLHTCPVVHAYFATHLLLCFMHPHWVNCMICTNIGIS